MEAPKVVSAIVKTVPNAGVKTPRVWSSALDVSAYSANEP